MSKELWLRNCATLALLGDHETKYVKRLGSPIDYTVTGQIEVYSCVPDTLSCLCSICSLGPLSYKPTLITSGLNEWASYLILPRGNSSLKLWWSKQPELKMIALPQRAVGASQKSICDMHLHGQPVRTSAKVGLSYSYIYIMYFTEWAGLKTNLTDVPASCWCGQIGQQTFRKTTGLLLFSSYTIVSKIPEDSFGLLQKVN